MMYWLKLGIFSLLTVGNSLFFILNMRDYKSGRDKSPIFVYVSALGVLASLLTVGVCLLRLID